MRSPGMPHLLLALCTAGSALACDGGKEQGGGDAEGNKAAANGAVATVEETVERAVPNAEKQVAADRLFDAEDKSIRKQACDWLTAELVASTFEVPADELKQVKIMGCVYAWRKDGQIVDAKVMMPRVHKTLEGATTWFDNATATKTAEQMAAEMDQVKARVTEHDKLDTNLKKKVAGDLTDIVKMGMPDEGVRYEDVPGIGSQARVSSANGVLWVRMGNLTFQVTGYKGPDQPKLEIDIKNLDGVAKASMEAQKQWIAATIDARRAGSKKLAPLVVAAIGKQ